MSVQGKKKVNKSQTKKKESPRPFVGRKGLRQREGGKIHGGGVGTQLIKERWKKDSPKSGAKRGFSRQNECRNKIGKERAMNIHR